MVISTYQRWYLRLTYPIKISLFLGETSLIILQKNGSKMGFFLRKIEDQSKMESNFNLTLAAHCTLMHFGHIHPVYCLKWNFGIFLVIINFLKRFKFTKLTWIFKNVNQISCLLMSLWDSKNASVCTAESRLLMPECEKMEIGFGSIVILYSGLSPVQILHCFYVTYDVC